MNIKIVLCVKSPWILARRKYKTGQEEYVLNPGKMEFPQVEAY